LISLLRKGMGVELDCYQEVTVLILRCCLISL
jgi:hypothetical protein